MASRQCALKGGKLHSPKKKPGKEKKLEGRGTGTLTRNPNFGRDGHPLKRAGDVERIKFTVGRDGQPIKIGGKHYGEVFLGKVSFGGEKQVRRRPAKDGTLREHQKRKWHRVAIKRFNDPERAYDGGEWYQETIDDLRNHRVQIPKMGMVRVPKGTMFGKTKLEHDEWLQVSQLYGSTAKGSKIHQKSWEHFPTPEGREIAVRELTRVADAWRNPAGDLLEPIKLKDGVSVIPFDLDELHHERMADSRANELIDIMGRVSRIPFKGKTDAEARGKREYRRLYGIAMEEATPAMKKAIERMERHRIKVENM
jgi:hypothetical protein